MRAPPALLLAAALASAAAGCLPEDTRPPPGSIQLTATNAGALNVDSPSLVTLDGWTLRYDRFLIGIGNGTLDGDNCDQYSEDRYNRILDARRTEPQKVGTLFALRHCDLGFTLRYPDADSVLGAGVTEADETFMRTPVVDEYTATVNGGLGAGVAVFVEGSARSGAATEHFAWTFRRRFNYEKCALPTADGLIQGVDFHSEQSQRVDIAIRGEALFADTFDAGTAVLRFDPIAAADAQYGDANGDVTLHELSLVPLTDVFANGTPPVGDAGIDPSAWTSLEDVVYLGRVLGVARIGGTGACATSITDRRRRD